MFPWLTGIKLYGLIALAVALVGMGIAIKVQSSRLASCRQEYELFKVQVEAIGKAQIAANKLEALRREGIVKGALYDYQKRLGGLAADYQRVRADIAGRGSVSALSNAAPAICAGTDPDTAGILARMEAGILGILETGDAEIAKYRALWQVNQETAAKP